MTLVGYMMPWELGLADSYKEMPNIAVLPSPENSNDMRRAEYEYLGIYARNVRELVSASSQYHDVVENRVDRAVSMTTTLMLAAMTRRGARY